LHHGHRCLNFFGACGGLSFNYIFFCAARSLRARNFRKKCLFKKKCFLCNALAYAMHWLMQCIGLCNASTYAMHQPMQCIDLCNASAYAMHPAMQCILHESEREGESYAMHFFGTQSALHSVCVCVCVRIHIF